MSDRLQLICGDALEELRKLPMQSVHCCVTSPPYWGLRDYKIPPTIWDGDPACEHSFDNETVNGELRRGLGLASSVHNTRGGAIKCAKVGNISAVRGFCSKCGAWRGCHGLEPTPGLYVKHEVTLFKEVHRVLRDDGTLWLNLGDTYTAGGCGGDTGKSGLQGSTESQDQSKAAAGQRIGHGSSFRPDRIQRQDAPWKKAPNIKSKNLIGIPWRVAFALQAEGWYLRSDIIWHKPNPMPESVRDRPTKSHEYIFLLSKQERYFYDAAAISEPLTYGSVERLSQVTLESQRGGSRVPGKTNGNMKAVYKKPYTNNSTKDYASSGAQDASATKSRIVDRILAGELVTRNKRTVWTVTTQPFKDAHFATFPPDLIRPCIRAGCPVDGTVLDPFSGSGTTGMVAIEEGRRAILIELNPEYMKLAEQRTDVTPGLALFDFNEAKKQTTANERQ